MSDTFNEDYEGEQDQDLYTNPSKNNYFGAKTDYAKALAADLNGDSVLSHYIESGRLTKSQAGRIKAEHNNQFRNSGDALDKYFSKNPFEQTTPQKPLANSARIVLKGLKTLPPRQYLVKRLEIEKGTLALLCASGSSGKSMLLQYIACCVSSGKKLFGQFDCAKGPVVHLDQEQNAVQTQRRYERLAAGLELTSLDVERLDLNRRLDSAESIKTAEDDLVSYFQGKTLVLIDSLKATSEADENSPQIEVILKILKRVAERTQTGVILIHHKGKSTTNTAKQSGRGHSSIYDSVDIQIDLDWNMETETADLVCRKNRDGKMFNGLRYRLLDTGDFNEEQNCSERLEFQLLEDNVKSARVTLETQILKVLKETGAVNQSKLFEVIGGDRKLFGAAIDKALEQDWIKESKGAKNARIFEITESGTSTLAWSDTHETK